MPGKYSSKNVRLELSLAGRDIESGDLTSAAARVSNVLVSAPSLAQAHEILALLAAHPRGGRELFPMTSPLALATVVARAHVVAAEGDFGYALGLLGKAQTYAPETVGLRWRGSPILPPLRR